MTLTIVPHTDLNHLEDTNTSNLLESALHQKGIVGISGIPGLIDAAGQYIESARAFMALNEATKSNYAPNRDTGETCGYELGAEQFKDADGNWQTDDKKASFYATVPDATENTWPKEVDLKSAYLNLADLMFAVGKKLMDCIGLNQAVGLEMDKLEGCGRMLHYLKESDATNANPNWCGAHYDHGTFTSLLPAYYFKDGVEVEEPEEAGLYIVPSDGQDFEKVSVSSKDTLLFQVGEFAQLISNDRIKATKHKVCKAKDGIERFAFALFYDAPKSLTINSSSTLAHDARYQSQVQDGHISYLGWHEASLARYRA